MARTDPARASRNPQRGQALVELTLVITIVLTGALSVFDLGVAYQGYQSVVQGATSAARAAMDTTKTDAAVIQAARNGAQPLTLCGSCVTVTRSTDLYGPKVTVKVSYTQDWITPLWQLGGPYHLSHTATSR